MHASSVMPPSHLSNLPIARIETHSKLKLLRGSLLFRLSMAKYYYNRRILFTILVIVFIIVVSFSQRGASCRPLQDDQGPRAQFDGLLLQFLPRGPVKPSAPDPIRP
ncbi:hypothetical protein CR513_53667, partial [Mucuna pruriens]